MEVLSAVTFLHFGGTVCFPNMTINSFIPSLNYYFYSSKKLGIENKELNRTMEHNNHPLCVYKEHQWNQTAVIESKLLLLQTF